MFRIWANRVLKEFIIKGYVMDDARLREPENFSARIISRNNWSVSGTSGPAREDSTRKSRTSIPSAAPTTMWKAPSQRSFSPRCRISSTMRSPIIPPPRSYMAVPTAPKPNMGLTTWKNAPKGRIRKSDVTVAKNYLNETEMRNLNEIVTMYLDYAERQARRGNVMYMADWVKRLDAFYSSTRKIFCMIKAR